MDPAHILFTDEEALAFSGARADPRQRIAVALSRTGGIVERGMHFTHAGPLYQRTHIAFADTAPGHDADALSGLPLQLGQALQPVIGVAMPAATI